MDWGKIQSRTGLSQTWKVFGFAENMVGGGEGDGPKFTYLNEICMGTYGRSS